MPLDATIQESTMPRILVVDDEPRILALMSGLLTSNGYIVTTARDGLTALEQLGQKTFDVILTDMRMPEMDGMELYHNLRKQHIETPVVFLTAYGTVESALEAMRGGAFDYVSKPFKVDELLTVVGRAVEHGASAAQQVAEIAQKSTEYQFGRLIAGSPAMHRVCEVIQRVATTATTVLINGESGTGKEVVARIVHEQSRRHDKPFVAVNCAALPEPLLESEMFGHVKGAFTGASADKPGLFETAEGGTLFLDEISSLPLGLQGKLLRALQEREVRRVGGTRDIPVNVRVIAASNANLEQLVTAGAFRADLFYRLAVIPVELPPLRDRTDDILPLAYHFIAQECRVENIPRPRLNADAEAVLMHYTWPGNVRELENAIRHAITFLEGEEITPEVLPARIVSRAAVPEDGPVLAKGHAGASLKAFLRQKEKEYLEQMMSTTGGDKEEAAKRLQISLTSLYRKLPHGNSEQ
jgi:DNA-binding NtrC family response regulator